jgi:hypothetical protein
MARATHLGAWYLGTVKDNATADVGPTVTSQTGTIAANAGNAVDLTFYLPANSRIIDIIVDTTTAWTSATSDTLSVGTASGGTTYASGVDVKTATGRIRPTFTAAQLLAMADIGTTNLAVVATVTPVGSAGAGLTRVTIVYSIVQAATP